MGFGPLASRVHNQGMKFGVWVIKGVFEGAAAARLPIKGTSYTIDEIVDQSKRNGSCVWAGKWLGINASHPGAQPFYDSLVQELASWAVDFIKIDCIFGHAKQGSLLPDVEMVAKAVQKVERPIALSLSPGGGIRPSDARMVAAPAGSTRPHATMYRVTNDFHGGW